MFSPMRVTFWPERFINGAVKVFLTVDD